MQIASVTYANAERDRVVIETDGPTLRAPWPIQSWHREVVEDWLAEGNTIRPYAPQAVPVPSEATVLQLYDEMDQVHGIDLEDAVAARSAKAGKRFRLANTIKRTDPMVADLQRNLGWTDAQVDDLFRNAVKR